MEEIFKDVLNSFTFSEKRSAEIELERLAVEAYYSDENNPCYRPFGEKKFNWHELSKPRKNLVRKYALLKFLSQQTKPGTNIR